MRSLKFISILAVVAIVLISCSSLNDTSFSDKDAFIGFERVSGQISEMKSVAKFRVRLSSISGLSGTAIVVVDEDASTAVAGVNYVDPGEITLNFDKENPVDTVKIDLINTESIGDSWKIVLKIINVTGNVKIGGDDTFNLTLNGKHPLDPILGTYAMTETSYFTGNTTYHIIISPVSGDLTKVSIFNIWGEDLSINGKGDLTNSNITIAAGQVVHKSATSELSYCNVTTDSEGYLVPDRTTAIVWTINATGDNARITGARAMIADINNNLYDYITAAMMVRDEADYF